MAPKEASLIRTTMRLSSKERSTSALGAAGQSRVRMAIPRKLHD